MSVISTSLTAPGEPEADEGEAYDQSVRFGFLGRFSDFLGRMPAVVIVDRRGGEPTLVYSCSGSSTFDRPEIDQVLAELDAIADSETG